MAVTGTNTPSLPSSCFGATLRQTTAGAIITSTQNIYHPFAVPHFVIEGSVSGDVEEVLVQVKSAGNPLDSGSFQLVYEGRSGPVALAPSSQGTLGATPGEDFVEFDLTSISDEIGSFQIEWSATAGNHSLDVVLIDVRSAALVMAADVSDVSLAAGGTQALVIKAGSDVGNGFYAIFGSFTGTGPTPLAGFDVPLTVDDYTLFALANANGAVLQNFIGPLDACGRGNAAIAVPAGTSASLAGLTLHHAALVFDMFGSLELVSNAVSIDLLF